jgi:hypothetical protein
VKAGNSRVTSDALDATPASEIAAHLVPQSKECAAHAGTSSLPFNRQRHIAVMVDMQPFIYAHPTRA